LAGDRPGEGPRRAGELAQLGPVPGERADHRDGEGQPDEGAYGDRPREVEPDDPGSVAPHDEQTEVVPAPHARAGPSGVRSRGLSGYEHRVDDAVNGGWLRPHARLEPRKRRAGRERTHNQSVGAHGPAIPSSEDPGSVAPHDEQTEVVPAPHARAGPSGVRSRGLSGYEHRVDDAVNGGWLRPHARLEPRKRRAGRERTHNQSVGAHGPAIPATRPALHVIIMARCRAVTPREIVIY